MDMSVLFVYILLSAMLTGCLLSIRHGVWPWDWRDEEDMDLPSRLKEQRLKTAIILLIVQDYNYLQLQAEYYKSSAKFTSIIIWSLYIL